MLQRTVFVNKIRMLQRTNMLQGTMLQRRVLLIKSGCYNEHKWYNEWMLQRTVFINKIRMLQRTQMLQRRNATKKSFYQENQDAKMNTDATTNECYNEQFLSIKSGCYNEHRCYKKRCYNEEFLSIKSGCYNEHRRYNEWMLQRMNATTNSFINKNEHKCYNERGGIPSADVAHACAWRVGPSLFD